MTLPRLQFKSAMAARKRSQTWPHETDTLMIKHEVTPMNDHLIRTRYTCLNYTDSNLAGEEPAVRIYQVNEDTVALQMRSHGAITHLDLTPDELRAIMLASSHILANLSQSPVEPRPDPITLTEFHD